jgi:capsular polysaccharide transport system permease protein
VTDKQTAAGPQAAPPAQSERAVAQANPAAAPPAVPVAVGNGHGGENGNGNGGGNQNGHASPPPGRKSRRRLALIVTLDVWRALFMREAVTRITGNRLAWFWTVFQPLIFVGFMMFIYTTIRVRNIPGADAVVWLLVGYIPFQSARNIFMRSMDAISANQALFVYRQVLPVDTVLVRAALEAFLGIIILILTLCLAALIGKDIIPNNIAKSMFGYVGLCLVGLGLGLILSVVRQLIDELGKVIGIFMMPLTILSGVIFPMSILPAQYREWLFLNPFAHGLEIIRSGFFQYYHEAPEASASYLYSFALVSIVLGLALQFRYTVRLREQ